MSVQAPSCRIPEMQIAHADLASQIDFVSQQAANAHLYLMVLGHAKAYHARRGVVMSALDVNPRDRENLP